MNHRLWIPLAVLSILFPVAASAQLVRSASGPNVGAIQASVDQFRLDLGTLNPNTPGSVGSGRREINWDGVPQAFSSPNGYPGDFFNAATPGRARGVVFSTPGTDFQVSANAGDGPIEFTNLDPSYADDFQPFSLQKVFTPIGSNVMDVSFFVPGTSEAAGSRGFGAVFSDVDLANVTSITYLDRANNPLGTFFAPSLAGDGALSFLGVSYADPIIGRVRLTLGNAALGAGVPDQNGDLNDLVVVDDLIFGEPTNPGVIPEPGTLALLLAGGAVAAWKRRRG